jgi:aryl-alcohol dehydrogenase-like predicted oxidoreductase
MQTRMLGATGMRVSRLCLGTMMFGERCNEAESRRILDCALEAGVNFIDTAAVYAAGLTEEILGRALAGRRERVIVATKVWVKERLDGEAVARGIEESLKRLRMDYVDLYLIHWPRRDMDVAGVMRGLGAVVRAGKARWVGCSNYPAWLLAHSNAIAAQNGWPLLLNNQVPYNPVERGIEVEILPQALAENIAITCYRPLLAGVLSGKYQPDQPLPADARSRDDERLPRWLKEFAGGVRALFALARAKEATPAQVAIAWVASHPAVTCPIVGVSSLAQWEEALQALEVTLTPEERETLSAAFDSPVREVSGGNFGPLRRALDLVRPP